MIKEFKLPELAEGVESAVMVGISVKVGDKVEKEQIVAELENSKATAEIPLPYAGTVKEIFKKVGDEIKVGETLLSVEVAEGGAVEASKAAPAAPMIAPAQPVTPAAPPVSAPAPALAESSPAEADAAVPAGPEVRRLARELGINLTEVEGSGPQGRITPQDVKTHTKSLMTGAQPQPAAAAKVSSGSAVLSLPPLPDFAKWGSVEALPMSGVRRVTAEVTTLSWQQIPHVTQHDFADITNFKALRAEWQSSAEKAGAKLTVTALLLKAVAAALKVFPRFNCSVDMAASKLIYKNYVHVALAVDAGHGLLTPVIRNADQKSVFAIATEIQTLSAKAKDKQLSIEEMSGSTFAISNLGALGTTSFGPIVTWPHVAVLGVSKSDIKPVWKDEAFVPRNMLPLSLSYDHRANDGADAARFLRWVAEAMEQPLKITMQAG